MTTVLVIGDTHCPGMKQGYVRFLQKVADTYQPDRIVHIGDLVDWNSISYHEKHPELPCSGDEVKEARKQVQELSKAFPKADWLLGNHDALPYRQATTAGIPQDALKPPNDFWEIGWKVYPRYGRLEIDNVEYTHGEIGPQGERAAYKQAVSRFQSVVIGHLHANAGAEWHATEHHRIFGLSVGCGVDAKKLQFKYGWKFKRKPLLGCGAVVNGTNAYFEPWLLKSK